MSERDPKKGALFARCIAELTLQDLVDVAMLKATLDGAAMRVKITYPRARRAGRDTAAKKVRRP